MYERLTRGSDVRSALRRGRRVSADGVVVHVRDRRDDGPARVAVVASRRVGGAVDRNRAKRVLRAAARDVLWPSGVDVVLVARESTGSLGSVMVSEQLIAETERMFDVRVSEAMTHTTAVASRVAEHA